MYWVYFCCPKSFHSLISSYLFTRNDENKKSSLEKQLSIFATRLSWQFPNTSNKRGISLSWKFLEAIYSQFQLKGILKMAVFQKGWCKIFVIWYWCICKISAIQKLLNILFESNWISTHKNYFICWILLQEIIWRGFLQGQAIGWAFFAIAPRRPWFLQGYDIKVGQFQIPWCWMKDMDIIFPQIPFGSL